ncbi:hypothetical protein PFLUV_G00025600 [Perca fluviatilis]|uniref:Uncharacterized protein n=1 Tax=Perca fluviatilis TaxID=8168 RepID=A0A6A5EWZ2_PERFL|nr:hypothetical protein PFLUV_G00025600 [Perca fluviatilis]
MNYDKFLLGIPLGFYTPSSKELVAPFPSASAPSPTWQTSDQLLGEKVRGPLFSPDCSSRIILCYPA